MGAVILTFKDGHNKMTAFSIRVLKPHLKLHK